MNDLKVFVLLVNIVCLVVGGIYAYKQLSGGGTSAPPPPAPPVRATEVPQAREAGIDVRPAFTVGAGASSVELTGPPVLHGFELLVPVRPLPVPGRVLPDACITVTTAESTAASTAAGAAGDSLTEYNLGTTTVHNKTAMAFPAVIPGIYALYTDCDQRPSGTPIALGSVTAPNVGVVRGAPNAVPANVMVLFARRTAGGATTLTYGVIGGTPDGALVPSLIPPANDACVDGGSLTGRARLWQPVRDLVAEQDSGGGAEWLQLGTLVFQGRPQGTFYYDCAQDIPGGEPGLGV